MKVQEINQSSIYLLNNRQDGSVGISCRPKPKSSRGNFSMPSFNGVVHKTLQQAINDSFKNKLANKSAEFSASILQPKTFMQEIKTLIAHTYNSIKESFNKSKTKKILVAPTRKLWSDFKSVAAKQVDKLDNKFPRLSPMLKGAAAAAAGISAADAATACFLA